MNHILQRIYGIFGRTSSNHLLSLKMVCEIGKAKIKLKQQHVYVIGIYRTHGKLEDSLDVMSQVLQTIPTWRKPTILMEDN